jgi:hypothetical protein
LGGRGSGRHPDPRAKATTEDYRGLDVRRLERERLLASKRDLNLRWLRGDRVLASVRITIEAGRVVVLYRHRLFPLRVDWTPCNYGGQRAWVLCPRCDRRVAIVYFQGTKAFACRRCHRLAYRCQREAADERAFRRANRIRERLGWKPGILNPEGHRPRGMHRETFERLSYRAAVLGLAALDGYRRRLGLARDAVPRRKS